MFFFALFNNDRNSNDDGFTASVAAAFGKRDVSSKGRKRQTPAK